MMIHTNLILQKLSIKMKNLKENWDFWVGGFVVVFCFFFLSQKQNGQVSEICLTLKYFSI